MYSVASTRYQFPSTAGFLYQPPLYQLLNENFPHGYFLGPYFLSSALFSWKISPSSMALFSICQWLPNVHIWVSLLFWVPNLYIQIFTQYLTSVKYAESQGQHMWKYVLFSSNLRHQPNCSSKKRKYHSSLLSIPYLPHATKCQVQLLRLW